MARLGGVLHVTEGQAYTLVIGLVLAVASAVVGIPPTLRDKAEGAPAALVPTPAEEARAPDADGGSRLDPSVGSDGARPLVIGRSATPTGELPSERTPPGHPSASDQEPPPLAAGTLAVIPEPGAPTGIAVTGASVWVGTDNFGGRGASTTPRVFQINRAGVLEGEHLVDTAEGDHALQGMAAFADHVYVLQASPPAVLRLDPRSGSLEAHATIPDLPACVAAGLVEPCEPSPVDRAPLPRGAAFDTTGNLFVTDANQGTIWKIPSGSTTADVFHQAVEYVSDDGPAGVAVDGAGNLVIAVTRSIVNGPGGAVYLLPVDESGAPGEPTLLAATELDSAPFGLALGASGRVYVALSGTDQILVLEPDGSEAARLLAGGELTCDAPAGVDFLGTGLVVTCQAPGDPSGAKVLVVPLDEPGL